MTVWAQGQYKNMTSHGYDTKMNFPFPSTILQLGPNL